MSEERQHQPVLVEEALGGLGVVADGHYVDATYGRGGHSAKILERLGGQGRLLALDKDPEAVAAGRQRFGGEPRFSITHAGFEDFDAVVRPWLGSAPLNGVLFDLGVSSPQIDEPARGFSFSREGPLDMRMDPTTGQSAADWLAAVSEVELAHVLRQYGEEPRAKQIAGAIVRARAREPITTTARLADVVAAGAGRGKRKIHPATRVFQALRIVVNRELAALEKGLAEAAALLAPGGRVAVISFHSLEDRIVKRFFARESRGDPRYAGLPHMPPEARPTLRLCGRLIRPSEQEVARNPRARSARLRVAEKLSPGGAA
ncbi:MAG: 16S rRNA (cytosine(1402)-N(4))-methyltransferase RsmH [Gammaproteobacteria bacterium]|nr:16S rRNA (cytosine(1402)-N(4))-methyltransferase RsmH [Gammaproteobacteria bacterium]